MHTKQLECIKTISHTLALGGVSVLYQRQYFHISKIANSFSQQTTKFQVNQNQSEDLVVDIEVPLDQDQLIISDVITVVPLAKDSFLKAKTGFSEKEALQSVEHVLDSQTVGGQDQKAYYNIRGFSCCLVAASQIIPKMPHSDKSAKIMNIDNKISMTATSFTIKTTFPLTTEDIEFIYSFHILQQLSYEVDSSMARAQQATDDESQPVESVSAFKVAETPPQSSSLLIPEKNNDLQNHSRKTTMGFEEELTALTTAMSEEQSKKKIVKKKKRLDDPNYRMASTGHSKNKGDKKNVVKNFVKALRGFICNWGEKEEVKGIAQLKSDEELEQYQKNFIQFEKKRKYNNNLIKELLQEEYKNLFAYFVQNKAQAWLKHSNVLDKKSHLDVLKGYIEASKDPTQLQKIVVLKTRNLPGEQVKQQ